MRFGLENFKPFGTYEELELNPLTVLIGPNGSGKSSILEAICLVAQSIGAKETPLSIEGKLVNYPAY